MDEWVARYQCSRCQHVLLLTSVHVDDDGRFVLTDFVNECTNHTCQASFGSETEHKLEITMYQKSKP